MVSILQIVVLFRNITADHSVTVAHLGLINTLHNVTAGSHHTPKQSMDSNRFKVNDPCNHG